MTKETYNEAFELQVTIKYLEKEVLAIGDAIAAGAVLMRADFSIDKESIDIKSKWLPEIKLSDVLIKVEAELNEAKEKFNSL